MATEMALKKEKRTMKRATQMDMKRFVYLASQKYGIGAVITRKQVQEMVEVHSLSWPTWLTNNKAYRVEWGLYQLPLLESQLKLIKQGKAKMGNINEVPEAQQEENMTDDMLEDDEFSETEVTESELDEDDIDGDIEDLDFDDAAPSPEQKSSKLVGRAAKKVNGKVHIVKSDDAPVEAESNVSHAVSTVKTVPAVRLNLVPKKDALYVPWGHYDVVKKVLETNRPFNMFITGLSGNGKTTMVEQVCAEIGRKLVRVNITCETDENDLFGGFRLVNGNTEWFDGPVVQAMKEGAVLLLDEVDLASYKIMCMQPVLEGKGILLKKINEFVKPAPGFTIIATANTKGKGSEDGRFVGTQVLNEAFLDRFPATIEQPYPPETVERQILKKFFAVEGVEESKDDLKYLIDTMLRWVGHIRKAFETEAVSEVISTRRLVDIAKGYVIYGDIMFAIKLSTARFDENTKTAFLDFWTKFVDEDKLKKQAEAAKEAERKRQEEIRKKGVSAAGDPATSKSVPAGKLRGILNDPNDPKTTVVFQAK